MEIAWIITLLAGFALFVEARNARNFALRTISRTFGPLLIAAGIVGFIITPDSWMMALILLSCLAAGLTVTYVINRLLPRR